MKFSDFFISVEDYNFFTELSDSEKILFVYDLICNETYGSGSSEVNTIDYIINNPRKDTKVSKINQVNSPDFITMLKSMISNSIDLDSVVNVFFINNFVIINSDYRSEIRNTVRNLFTNGLILVKMRPGKSTLSLFKHQKHLSVYHIAGQSSKLSSN